MAISFTHDEDVQVWDGLTFTMMSAADAKKADKAGTHQITKNLRADQLKTAAEFNAAREAKQTVQTKVELPPGAEAPAKTAPTRKKRTYKTRDMKAEK